MEKMGEQGCRKWQDGQENVLDKLSSVIEFGFGESAKYVPLSDCWSIICAKGWTVLCPTV